MAWTPPVGPCRLCGNTGPLSKEHIPAKGGLPGGGGRIEVRNAEQYFDDRKGRIYQRGYHEPVFCESCNKLTGSWYGTEYAGWSKWGLSLLEAGRQADPPLIPVYRGYPLRVAKQVIATMIAASGEGLTGIRPDLSAFVLNRDVTLDAGALRLATYLCPTPTGRSTGVAWAFAPGREHQLCEYSSPPFGYVLTLSGEPLDGRPVDISWFASCAVDERRSFDLPGIPVLPTHEAFPGDYRTRDEIRLDVIRNILDERGHPEAAAEARRIFETGAGPAFLAENGEEW